MKTIKNLTLLMGLCAVILLAAGCDKTDDTGNTSGTNPIEEPKPVEESIVGKWKLIEGSVSVNHSQPDITDYSKENIIFDFQENNRLVVTGHMPDILGLFDDYQEGEHFYEYLKFEVGACPGPNLSIDSPEFGSGERRSYFCTALSYEETMSIIGDKVIGGVIDDTGLVTGGDYYRGSITFIKLN